MQDIIITREQDRNAQLYQRTKLQATDRGVRLLIRNTPQKVPPEWSRDAHGIDLFGVQRNDVRTIAGYERAKVRAAVLGARLCLVDE
jgi:hypothetical protein